MYHSIHTNGYMFSKAQCIAKQSNNMKHVVSFLVPAENTLLLVHAVYIMKFPLCFV